MTKEEIEQAAENYANECYEKGLEQISILSYDELRHYRKFNFIKGAEWALQSENERLKAERELEIINFATWYSCESEGTVKSAYKRYKKLSPHKQ